jgi:capsular exopolysaccharide synthesis family protein
MGKVYEALQRAEAERGRRGGAVVPGIAAPTLPTSERAAGRARAGRLARLRGWIARRVRGAAEVEDANAYNKRRIALLQPDSFVAEQFRTLRARLDALAAERPVRTIAVTSAMPNEGKTTAALNLALVSSMSLGRRVLLVDCDLRRPKIHAVLGLRPEAGLAEVLTGDATLERARVKVDGTQLDVLPVRTTPSNPSELLASDRMRALVEELARSYDQVIFDTPPTLALPDATTVSELTDGIVLVVRANATPRDDVIAALDVLDRRRVLGLVLNDVEAEAERYGY